jgi:hypothetical protein
VGSESVVVIAESYHLFFSISPGPVLKWYSGSEISVSLPFVVNMRTVTSWGIDAVYVADNTTSVSLEDQLFC